MHNSNEGCNTLLETTARALNKEALQLLFVTAQERSIALCIRYAIRNVISILDNKEESASPEDQKKRIDPRRLARWFPHFWEHVVDEDVDFDVDDDAEEFADVDHFYKLTKKTDSNIVHNRISNISLGQSSALKSNRMGTWQQNLLTSIDTLLVLEHSFYLFHQKDPQPLQSAATKYKKSNIPAKVKLAMKDVFKQYGNASENEKIEMILNVVLQNQMTI